MTGIKDGQIKREGNFRFRARSLPLYVIPIRALHVLASLPLEDLNTKTPNLKTTIYFLTKTIKTMTFTRIS
jgi:hypothetical protein